MSLRKQPPPTIEPLSIRHSCLLNQLGRRSATLDHGKKQVLDRDEIIVESGGPPLGRLEQGAQSIADLRHGASGDARRCFQPVPDAAPQAVDVGADATQKNGNEPFILMEKSEEKVLWRDLRVSALNSC